MDEMFFLKLMYVSPEEVSDGSCDLMTVALSTSSNTVSIYHDYILENNITSDRNFQPTFMDL